MNITYELNVVCRLRFYKIYLFKPADEAGFLILRVYEF